MWYTRPTSGERNRQMNISIQRRKGRIVNLLIGLMLLVGLIPLIMSGKALIDYNAEILETNQRQIHSQICQSVASGISQYLGSCFNTIEPVKKYLELEFDPEQPSLVFLDTKTRALITDLFEFPRAKILNIRVVSSDSVGLQAGYAIPGESILNAELRKAFQECIKPDSPGTYVSRPFITSDFGGNPEPVFVLAKTVTRGSVKIGAVTVVFSLADVFGLFTSNPAGNTVFLLDNNGIVILHPDRTIMRRSMNLSASPVFQEMKNLKSRAISTLNYTDTSSGGPVEMMASVFLVQDANVSWGVVVQIPEAMANMEVRNMIMTAVIWILLSIALTLLLSYFFSLRISIPIQMLTMRTLAIKEGRFSERVQIHSRNELGILADNFNTMAEYIERYIKELKNAAEENRELFFGSIRTLAAAIDAKDPYTKGHSDRVMQFSEMIGREMKLPAEELEKLRIAALLHDVGKIGISDAILRKPGILTDEEYEIMKRHPQLGADIMKQIPKLAEVIPGMRFHHESLDGSGYPLGLQGDKIPLSARIIGVADTFDAMTTDRPYQKGFTMTEALTKIRNLSGKKFDYRIVSAMVAVYERSPKSFEKINQMPTETDITFH